MPLALLFPSAFIQADARDSGILSEAAAAGGLVASPQSLEGPPGGGLDFDHGVGEGGSQGFRGPGPPPRREGAD
jgi:hypothetical protein